MKKPSLMKSGRCMVVVALSALLPVTAALAETPTYSGERQFQEETPGAQGPVRSDVEGSQMQQDSTPMQTQRGAEGPTRSELEAQGYTGDKTSRDTSACPAGGSEKFAPNAYYGESNPFYSAEGKASFLGKGRWC